MTFAQLQYLLEIHRTGSVTQAAKNLFVSQSSVSLALSALEKELGFSIFIRSKKGLVPTEKVSMQYITPPASAKVSGKWRYLPMTTTQTFGSTASPFPLSKRLFFDWWRKTKIAETFPL